jgi:drug/metabolite transporter (DMT)-like permease
VIRGLDARIQVAAGFVVVCLVWGTTPFAIKVGLVLGWPPLWFCALRLFLAAAFLLPLLPTGYSGQPLGRQGRRIVLPMGVFGIALNFGLTIWGQQYIGAALASLIVGTQPITTTLIAHAVNRQAVPLRFGVSLLVGAAGMVVVFRGAGVSGLRELLGALAVFGGVTIYGAIFVYIKARVGALNLVRVVATQNLIGSLLVAPAALLLEGIPRPPSDLSAWVVLGYLVVISSIVALIIAVWLIGRMGPARFSILSFITPLVGVAASVIWLDEVLDAAMMVGAGLIGVALLLALGPGSTPADRSATAPTDQGLAISAPLPGRVRSRRRPRAAAGESADAVGQR